MLNHTQRRCFSVASRFLFKNEIRPAVAPRDLKKGDVKTFERNFPIDQDDQNHGIKEICQKMISLEENMQI